VVKGIDRGKDSQWREKAGRLAAELRGAIEALNLNAPDLDALDAAVGLACELRERLAGPRRRRWYDDLEDRTRQPYIDMSPIRGHFNAVAPPLSIRVVDPSRDALRVSGRVRLGMSYEAPPGGVHGGIVAALLDDILAAAQGLSGSPAYTKSLFVRYRAVTPTDTDLDLAAWLESADGRSRRLRAEIRSGGRPTAEAEATFVEIDPRA